jgi:hypothetical protein
VVAYRLRLAAAYRSACHCPAGMRPGATLPPPPLLGPRVPLSTAAAPPLRSLPTHLLSRLLTRTWPCATIRLGFIGPIAGYQLQHDFYDVFENLLSAAIIRPYTEATRGTVLLDVAQLLHEDIYSSLFQNRPVA